MLAHLKLVEIYFLVFLLVSSENKTCLQPVSKPVNVKDEFLLNLNLKKGVSLAISYKNVPIHYCARCTGFTRKIKNCFK